jgi:hypothetical protein
MTDSVRRAIHLLHPQRQAITRDLDRHPENLNELVGVSQQRIDGQNTYMSCR